MKDKRINVENKSFKEIIGKNTIQLFEEDKGIEEEEDRK
jgi:hypothetical protein